MNKLNLIYPERSDIKFTTMLFPDGQPHIKIDVSSTREMQKDEQLQVICRINNPSDLMMVMFVKNTLDYLEFTHVELLISYLMAARMDRVMLDGEPFSLKVVAGVLNQGGFRKIKIFDPHSEVSTALIDRSYAVTNHEYVREVLDGYFERHGKESYCLVSPDAGALKKIHGLARFLDVHDVVECMKERDLRTGALTNFKTTTENLSGMTCFIVDDICDGGGTFAGTAEMLRKKGAVKVHLIVSHGIFSKGVTIPHIDEIFTTDSFHTPEGLKPYDVEGYLR